MQKAEASRGVLTWDGGAWSDGFRCHPLQEFHIDNPYLGNELILFLIFINVPHGALQAVIIRRKHPSYLCYPLLSMGKLHVWTDWKKKTISILNVYEVIGDQRYKRFFIYDCATSNCNWEITHHADNRSRRKHTSFFVIEMTQTHQCIKLFARTPQK